MQAKKDAEEEAEKRVELELKRQFEEKKQREEEEEEEKRVIPGQFYEVDQAFAKEIFGGDGQ